MYSSQSISMGLKGNIRLSDGERDSARSLVSCDFIIKLLVMKNCSFSRSISNLPIAFTYLKKKMYILLKLQEYAV